MTTALITANAFLEHDTGPDHPESPDRLRAILRFMDEHGMLTHPDLKRMSPRLATDDELAAAHTPEHIASVEAASRHAQAGRRVRMDADTPVGPRSAEVARLAAGGVLIGVDAVVTGQTANAVALIRPPGHHAEKDAAMGFCLYNNVAVAARYAQRQHGIGKVLIVDYDVHHGNGTQHIFYDDPTVAYFSTHQAPFYPGTGTHDEIGEGAARFTTCNAPVPAGSLLELYDAIFREILFPFADRFQPDLVLLSAGFDAHWRDPLADELLDVQGYALLTHYVQEIAGLHCGGKLVAALEGGYDLDALSQCMASLVALFLGEQETIDTLGPSPQPRFRWNADAVVEQLRQVQELVGFRRKPRLPGPAPDEP